MSVGSGTIVDIAKVRRDASWSSPTSSSRTAASVNGFADDQSVLLDQRREAYDAKPVARRLGDRHLVVAEAPIAMNRSGLGDQLSMFSAAADWYLASAVGFDASFSPTLARDDAPRFDRCWRTARATSATATTQAVDLLASCLADGGIAMGVAGRTAPSSGTEHVISHLLEMHADAARRPAPRTAPTVGVTSVLAVLLWQRMRDALNAEVPGGRVERRDARERVLAAFARLDDTGAAAHECWSAYERKLDWIPATSRTSIT